MLQGYSILVRIVVNAGLIFINLLTRGDDGGWWFSWPLAAWGAWLAVHTLVTFTACSPPGGRTARPTRSAASERAVEVAGNAELEDRLGGR